jgi:LPXTG-motif cell wall-anchored protein
MFWRSDSRKHFLTTVVVLLVMMLAALPVLAANNPFAETGRGSGKAILLDDTPAWESKATIPEGRVFHATVADNYGHVYVIGGTSDAWAATPTNTIYQYETSNDVWATLSPMPAALDSISGAVINNKIYIPGDSRTADTYVYSIATDSWATIPANGGYTPRSQYSCVAMGTDLYVLGGIIAADGASTTQVWILNTVTETWAPGVAMQSSRTSFAAAVLADTIVAAGGVLFPGFSPDMTVEAFDGTTWSYVASLPNGDGAYTRWSYMAAGGAGDQLWLAGGRRDASWGVLNHAGYYDLSDDTWTATPDVPTLAQGRVYMTGAVAKDGYFYVTGGRDSAGSEVYTTNERLYVGGVPGSLEVILSPEAAVDAGGQWSIDGGSTWYDSGFELSLEPDLYTIEFSDVAGWITPDPIEDVAVVANVKTSITGVTYVPEAVAVTGITLNLSQLELTVGGEKATLIATITPENASNQGLIWNSSNESVATVAANSPAEVTPVGAGTAVITAVTEDGGYAAHCTVVVRAASVDDGDEEEPLPDTGASLGSMLGGLLLAAAGFGVRRKK